LAITPSSRSWATMVCLSASQLNVKTQLILSPALPFLQHTELLLLPTAVLAILWFASLFGFNMPRHLAPVLWAGASLRKAV